MESIFPSLDKDVLKLLKSYNFVKANQNLLQLADDLSTFEKNLSQAESANLSLFAEITQELTETSNLLHKNYQSLLKETKILSASPSASAKKSKKIRIFMDGVFDIIHSGHFNALRQGRKFGDILVVGVNSDADVEKAKGPTLMNVRERAALIAACKWVDEVVIDTPYTPTIELLDSLNIDFCSHGDDPCFNEKGEDVYGEMKKQNRFKVFRRTEGISTTEIIGRLLMLSKESSLNQQQCKNKALKGSSEINKESNDSNQLVEESKANSQEVLTSSNLVSKSEDEFFTKGPVVSSFLTTGWRLQEFCNNRFPKENDKVIYIDGAFDILHIGHIETLRKAKELGDYLFVGVHDDATVNKHRGKNYPILNMQERVLNLLALKYVDDVVIGAPWKVTEDIVKSLKIDLVVQGTQCKYDKEEVSEQKGESANNPNENGSVEDPYAVPKKLGIYQEILSDFDLTNDVLVQRLIERRENYIKKYQNKAKKEEDYYKQKEYLSEV